MFSSAHKQSACTALAKHVSADGCQFVVRREEFAPGQRLRFNLEGFEPVAGTVRWIVDDRVGFAFDRPLCRKSQEALSGYCRSVHGVELYLA